MQRTLLTALGTFTLAVPLAGEATAQSVPLQNATATFSQTSFGGNPVTAAIDGNLAGVGWSIYEGPTDSTGNIPGNTNPQTAVFETVSNLSSAAGPSLTFTLSQNFNVAAHTLGHFRLSATTDARTEFADGLLTGGDVTANWAVLTPLTASATNGATLSILGDGSILASGTNPANSVYTIVAANLPTGITGFRLEALADASFPDSGPGRAPNGNFSVSEFQVSVTPEPTALALLGVCGGVVLRRRSRIS